MVGKVGTMVGVVTVVTVGKQTRVCVARFYYYEPKWSPIQKLLALCVYYFIMF